MRIRLSYDVPPSNPYDLLPIHALVVCDNLNKEDIKELKTKIWCFGALLTMLREVVIFKTS